MVSGVNKARTSSNDSVVTTRCHGIVFPLLTASGGAKFGKTEEGTVWLDPERTSPYRFYQYWLNAEDADVIRYLRLFTLLDESEMAELEHAVAENPHRREAQRRLAAEVTRNVHGAAGLERAERASRVLFGGSLEGLGVADIEEIFADVPSTGLARSALEGDGIDLAVLMADSAMAPSRSEARRLIKGGGVSLNGARVDRAGTRVGAGAPLQDRFLVVRVGKKRFFLLEVE